MKKLFTNYNFEFSKNEIKLLTSFCRQTLKQTEGDDRFFSESKAFTSILNKLNSGENAIKLTRDEKTRLTHQLKNNTDYLNKQIKKSWFLKKWLYKSLHNQYSTLLENHFKD
jgi:hypothetical protein